MGWTTIGSRALHPLLASLLLVSTCGIQLGCSGLDEAPASADEAFRTAENQWEYAPVAGARCGNGSSYGVAVNRSAASRDVVVLLASGGLCFDGATCFDIPGLVSHIADTLDEGQVLSELEYNTPRSLLVRDLGQSPFAAATFVYMPYCTGDLFVGQNIADYDTASGTRRVHHLGADAIDRVLGRLHATLPDAERIWLAGSSAGGLGALLNWWRARAVWPDARIDVLNDAGMSIVPPPESSADERASMFFAPAPSWRARRPPDCDACDAGFYEYLPFYATSERGSRFALTVATQDSVLAFFAGVSAEVFEASLATQVEWMRSTPGQRAFTVTGELHGLTGNPELGDERAAALSAWLQSFANDDPAWGFVAPE